MALGTDAPTAPYDPLANLYIAATRKSAFDPSLAPNVPGYAMAIADAVRRATRDAAYAARWDGELGVLRPGAAADFFVIDADPFRDGADVLLDARVRFTVLAGEVVHSAAAVRA
jgi:hypothetical protein